MIQSIVHIALVVKDYDEAIEFYTKKLNFTFQFRNEWSNIIRSCPKSSFLTAMGQLPFNFLEAAI